MAKGVEKIHEFSLRLFVNPTLSGHGSKVSLGLLNNSILQVSILTTLDIGLKSDVPNHTVGSFPTFQS